MLVKPVHHRTCIHAGQTVEEVEAALNAALHQRAGKLAGVVGHVKGGDVDGACSGRAQTDGEALVHVQDDLGNVEAGVADGKAAVGLGLFDQLVVRVVQQVLKED